MRNVLVTGGTGLVGSAFISDVLRKTTDVFITALVRSRLGKSADQRLEEVLEEQFEFDDVQEQLAKYGHRLTVIDCDIATCDVTEIIKQLKGQGIDTVFHCAADVNLGKDVKGNTFNNNCNGTANIIEIGKALAAKALHFVSTAYVSGRFDGMVNEDELVQQPVFNNAYEKSKYFSEQKVRQSGIPYSIYRPSIIVGRRTDGRIRKPLAFYRILEFVAKIKKNVCAKHGLQPTALLDFPLRFQTENSDKVYLVPIDFVQESLFELFFKPADNRTFHITGKQPISTRMILSTMRKYLNMPKINVINKIERPNRVEKMMSQFVEDLFPYFSSKMVFGVENVCKILGHESVAWDYGKRELDMLTECFYQDHFPEIISGKA